jgi:hypothetical protein
MASIPKNGWKCKVRESNKLLSNPSWDRAMNGMKISLKKNLIPAAHQINLSPFVIVKTVRW